MADEIEELRKVQSIQAIALVRLEVALEKLDVRFDDLRDDIGDRLNEARDDRVRFQHDIRESVNGIQAVMPMATAASAWIEQTGKPVAADHAKVKSGIKFLAWVGGLVGIGSLAAEALKNALKSKGLWG